MAPLPALLVAAAVAAAPGQPARGAAPSCDGRSCSFPRPSASALADILAPTPRVLAFVGRTCPACRRAAPAIEAARRVCPAHGVRIERVDADVADGAELTRRHAVRALPTFVLLDAQGREVERLEGEQPAAVLERALSDLAGSACSLRPLG